MGAAVLCAVAAVALRRLRLQQGLGTPPVTRVLVETGTETLLPLVSIERRM